MGINNNIGSVSHATMRPEDLIPAFVSELQSQKPLHRNYRKLIREINRNLRNDRAEMAYYDSDECGYDLEALFDALNEYAPAYFYFGAHPGDGSDYGYWLSEDFQDEFADLSTNFAKSDGAYVPDGSNIKVNDLADVPRGFSGEVLLVNDHGNMSLYAYSRGRRHELWAIV